MSLSLASTAWRSLEVSASFFLRALRRYLIATPFLTNRSSSASICRETSARSARSARRLEGVADFSRKKKKAQKSERDNEGRKEGRKERADTIIDCLTEAKSKTNRAGEYRCTLSKDNYTQAHNFSLHSNNTSLNTWYCLVHTTQTLAHASQELPASYSRAHAVKYNCTHETHLGMP